MPATGSNRLLKAGNLRGLGSKIAFNYEDLKQRCESYIEGIRNEAKQILTDAKKQADQIQRQAKQQGQEEGIRQGRQESIRDQEAQIDAAAVQKSTRRLQTTLPAIDAIVEALDTERNRWLAEWQDTTIRLSVAIAEKLLRRELQERPELTKESIIEALELAAGSPRIQLRMNPADVENLGSWCQNIIKTISPVGNAEVVSDPAISPGGCLVETKHGTIDGQIETKLDRIAQELLDN